MFYFAQKISWSALSIHQQTNLDILSKHINNHSLPLKVFKDTMLHPIQAMIIPCQTFNGCKSDEYILRFHHAMLSSITVMSLQFWNRTHREENLCVLSSSISKSGPLILSLRFSSTSKYIQTYHGFLSRDFWTFFHWPTVIFYPFHIYLSRMFSVWSSVHAL